MRGTVERKLFVDATFTVPPVLIYSPSFWLPVPVSSTYAFTTLLYISGQHIRGHYVIYPGASPTTPAT